MTDRKEKFTPGPLTVGYDGPSRPIILGPIGVMLSISQYQYGRWTSYDNEDADAHLFAAAPEMYEALQKVRDACKDFKFQLSPETHPLFGALLTVDAALAKARGEL